ncbi:MAG TPA: zinc-binding dehydrogenase [Solirubrobacterales bacterium]|jgi:threonine dehydrogenase-like Zn-dependent dehydrogenase|nr:zinc-binding dehydrogenase [Solirubrobacterales bacterium]
MPRAAVIRESGSAELVEVPLPVPGEGEVRVRLEGSGVCGSDLPVWVGRPWFEYPRPPGAPGHEGWGVVDAVGSGVSGLREGDRVAGLVYRAYADYDVARAADLVPLPEGAGPFPGEALGCAVNVVCRSGIREGDTVAVVGAGFLGCVIVQLAAAAGARVLAISRRSSALETAAAMGAAETIALEEPVSERVEELTGGELCDVVIEAAGVQSTLDVAGPLTRTRGRLVIAGFHQDGSRQVDMQLWNWRGLDVVNAHERDPALYVKGIREATVAVAAGRLDPSPLYTHRFELDQLDVALDTAVERPEGFIKALVMA